MLFSALILRNQPVLERAPVRRVMLMVVLCLFSATLRLRSQEPQPEQQTAPAQAAPAQAANPEWHYGGFVDLGYLLDFNDPANRLFRNRGTTFHVDEFDVNMAEAYIRKDVSDVSRWGVELGVQGGEDSKVFGFSATAPNLAGSNVLRHAGAANVSYLAPMGHGLKLQAGIFSSFIGYDSLYAKDNFNYTRPWGADYTPYLMMGVNASYDFNKKLSGALFVINGYWHLAHANNVPSTGGQLAYKPSDRVTLKETILYGPQQSNTALEFWRFFSDSSIERKGAHVTAAFEYQIGAEEVDISGRPLALWTAAQLPVHWNVRGRWSVAVRPEFAWDRNGRWTGFEQTIKAFTTTLEYRIPYRQASAILRLEHRVDDSRGKGGGFFTDGAVSPGVPALTPTQHLLIFAAIFTFDSAFHW